MRRPLITRHTIGAVPCLAIVWAVASTSHAQREDGVGSARPTWPWVVTQLVPSPQLVVQDGNAAFGARWQITPVLFSWGIHRSQNPWRFFVAEPIVRQSGSVEWHVSPEYLALGDGYADRFGLRTGVRSYVPVIERGDYLSVSFGTSALRFQEVTSVAYEAGAHSFFGFLGLMVSYSPTPQARRFITTLQVRFF